MNHIQNFVISLPRRISPKISLSICARNNSYVVPLHCPLVLPLSPSESRRAGGKHCFDLSWASKIPATHLPTEKVGSVLHDRKRDLHRFSRLSHRLPLKPKTGEPERDPLSLSQGTTNQRKSAVGRVREPLRLGPPARHGEVRGLGKPLPGWNGGRWGPRVVEG